MSSNTEMRARVDPKTPSADLARTFDGGESSSPPPASPHPLRALMGTARFATARSLIDSDDDYPMLVHANIQEDVDGAMGDVHGVSTSLVAG